MRQNSGADADEDWQLLPFAARKDRLTRLRHEAPDQAREQLAALWSSAPANHRQDYIAILADNLTAADVPGLLVERVRRDLADPVVVSTMGEEAVEQLRSGLSAILAAQRHDAAEFSRHVNPDVDPEWLIDGCQEICVALAAHAATIGWQRPEVDVSNVFASLDMVSEPDLVRTLLRQA